MAAEDVGSIESTLRLNLTQMEKDALAAQKRMDNLSKQFGEQGKKAGTVYVQGFGKVQQQLNTRLNNMVSSLQSISPKMGALGVKMATAFSAPIFSMVPAVSTAFSTMMGPIGMIISAVQTLWGWVGKAIDYFKDKSKDALNEVRKSIDEIKNRASTTRIIIDMKQEQGIIDKLEAVKQKIDGINRDIESHYALIEKIENGEIMVKNKYSEILSIKRDIALLDRERVNMEFYELNPLQQAHDLLKQRIELINDEKFANQEAQLAIKSNTDGYKGQMQIQNKLVDSLKSQLSALDRIIISNENATGEAWLQLGYTEKTRDMLRSRIENEEKELEKLRAAVKIEEEEKEIRKAMANAVEKYAQAELKAKDAKAAGFIDEEKYLEQIAAARAQEYSDLEAIILQHRNATGAAQKELEAVVNLRDEEIKGAVRTSQREALQVKVKGLIVSMEDELTEQKIAQLKADAASKENEAEKNSLLDKAIELENELIDKQRQRAKEALKESDVFKAASDVEQKTILENFDKITAGMKKAKEKAEKKDKKWVANLMQVGDAAIDAYQAIADAALEISRKHAEEQIAGIERALKEMLNIIEKAREAELEQKGFIEAQSEEEYDRQIERAKKAGDEILQYHLERRKEEMEINKKYDAWAKAEEDKAAKDKADIEFRVAKQEHAMQIIQATNAGVMAVVRALAAANPPINFILAGLVGGAAATQLGLLISNPPTYPQFADGGIVPGRKADGDVQHIMATAGEVILNNAQQENLAGKLENGRFTQLTVVLQVDSREMARSMADVYGSGTVLIPARGIAR
jgi:hypothetical protein